MRLFTATTLLLASFLASAQKIAITIDDAPFGYSTGFSDQAKIEAFDEILAALEKHKIKATFFVTSSNLNDVTKVNLDKAVAKGHQLANCTHSNMDLNTVSAAGYIADIEKCETSAGEWINSSYFRFPKLHRGDTKSKRDSVQNFLTQKGYVIAPITINNNEWVYNRGYSLAIKVGDQKVRDRIGKEYLTHMKEVAERYHKLSLPVTDGEIPQILQIHANPINAKLLGKLLDRYKKQNWEFITLDEAMRDPFYQIEDTYVGPYGFSQLDRVKRSTASN